MAETELTPEDFAEQVRLSDEIIAEIEAEDAAESAARLNTPAPAVSGQTGDQ